VPFGLAMAPIPGNTSVLLLLP